MDRPIDATVHQRRRLRRAGTATAVLAIVVAALLWLPGLVRPSVSRSAVRTAVTDAGPIESVITATGTVVPEVEQVVSSPVDARVLRILARSGAPLTKGDPLVTLDVSEAQLAVDKLIEDQALKENEQASTRLKLEKSLTVRVTRANGRLRVTIEDTGPGVPPDVREQLFTPFFTTKPHGQGIGLTMVQEILSNHGFEFSLDSAPDGPTRFTIDM
jgi:multidrug efflux pump subunit AcrA (membrane-fusion protein)